MKSIIQYVKNNASYFLVTAVLLVVNIAPSGCFDPVWHEEPEMPETVRNKIDTETCFCFSDYFKSLKSN